MTQRIWEETTSSRIPFHVCVLFFSPSLPLLFPQQDRNQHAKEERSGCKRCLHCGSSTKPWLPPQKESSRAGMECSTVPRAHWKLHSSNKDQSWHNHFAQSSVEGLSSWSSKVIEVVLSPAICHLWVGIFPSELDALRFFQYKIWKAPSATFMVPNTIPNLLPPTQGSSSHLSIDLHASIWTSNTP